MLLRTMKMEAGVQAAVASQRLKIARASPGVLFALFGVALIVVQYPVAVIVFFLMFSIAAGVCFAVRGLPAFSQRCFRAERC